MIAHTLILLTWELSFACGIQIKTITISQMLVAHVTEATSLYCLQGEREGGESVAQANCSPCSY